MVTSEATLDPALSQGPAQRLLGGGGGGGVTADGRDARENGRVWGSADMYWLS